jgi:hypothetical protein
MVRDGKEWFPVRATRSADNVAVDQDSYARKEGIAALGSRPRRTPLRRSFNLPLVAPSIFHESNTGLFSFRKQGEEKIAGVSTWRIGFEQKQSIAGDDPLSVILWIQPDTGQVLKTQIEQSGTTIEGPREARVVVQYSMNQRFSMLVPSVMQEHYEDAFNIVDGSAQYAYIRRQTATSTSRNTSSSDANSVSTGGEFTLRVDVPLISFDVSVSGDRGAVTDLKSGDFRIYEDDVPQSVAHFTPVSVPFNVLLLFDWSGSTRERRPLLQQAATALVEHLRYGDWVGLGRFSAELEMAGWTASRTEAARRIAQLRDTLKTNTNFYSSVETALANEILPFVGRHRALVVLTDGRDNAFEDMFLVPKLEKTTPGKLSLSEAAGFGRLLDIARQERIPIYIVAVSTPLEF